MDSHRRETMISIISNVIRCTIYFIFVVMTLQTTIVHRDIAGHALGCCKFAHGIFVLLEDQYGVVGDYATINGQTGTVTQIGIRLTRLQVWTDEHESILNGVVQQVTNLSRNNTLAVIDAGVNCATVQEMP